MIVTSAGGKAVVAADGSFELEVEVPIAAESVQITAIHGSATTSVPVPMSTPGGTVPTGVLTLHQGGAPAELAADVRKEARSERYGPGPDGP